MKEMQASIESYINGKEIEPNGIHIITTPDTKTLGTKIQKKIQTILDLNKKAKPGKKTITCTHLKEYEQFANGESVPTLPDSIRGKHVYLISDPHGDAQKDERSLNDKITFDKLIMDAAKSNGANTINLVQLCMPYARQDKTTPGKRQPASFDRYGKELATIIGDNGYIIDMDLHNTASKSALQGPTFINLHTGWFVKQVKNLIEGDAHNLILSGADQGGDKKISSIAKAQSIETNIVIKSRNYAKKNSVDTIKIYGDKAGKNIIIHDDILDTGGSLCSVLQKMLEDEWAIKVCGIQGDLAQKPSDEKIKAIEEQNGEIIKKEKPKSINIAITHGQFNKDAFKKLQNVIDKSNGVIQNIYITDSINKQGLPDFVKVISSADIVANSIFSIFKGYSVNREDDTNYTNTQSPKSNILKFFKKS